MSKTIYLVAGHGAGDPGAVGNNTQEAIQTRRVADALYSRLNGKTPVKMYPQNQNLYRSADYSKFDGCDVIEIHFNSYSQPAYGTEVLIKTGFTPDAIDNGLLSAMAKYFKNRGIKYRSDLKNMNSLASRGVSYRLIEVCFINSSDMTTYNNNFNALMDDMANAIIKANGGSATVSTPSKPSTGSTSTEMYRVRKSWANTASQLSANKVLEYAIATAKKNPGYSVFDSKGNVVYPTGTSKKSNEEIAREIKYSPNYGGWGVNPERKNKLTAAGYDAAAIQSIINKL